MNAETTIHTSTTETTSRKYVCPSPMQPNSKNQHVLKEYHQILPSWEETLENIVLSNSNALSRTPLYPPTSRGWEMAGQTMTHSVDIWKVEEFGRQHTGIIIFHGWKMACNYRRGWFSTC